MGTKEREPGSSWPPPRLHFSTKDSPRRKRARQRGIDGRIPTAQVGGFSASSGTDVFRFLTQSPHFSGALKWVPKRCGLCSSDARQTLLPGTADSHWSEGAFHRRPDFDCKNSLKETNSAEDGSPDQSAACWLVTAGSHSEGPVMKREQAWQKSNLLFSNSFCFSHCNLMEVQFL